jgi:hypothetical protein
MPAARFIFLAGAICAGSCLAQSLPVFAPMSLVINEMMIDPPAGLCEWIEIFNTGSEPVSLEGWRISDRDTANPVRICRSGSSIPPQGFAVTAADSSLRTFYDCSGFILLVPEKFPSLNNAGDRIILMDPNGCIIDAVEYGPEWDLPQDVSLEKLSPSWISGDAGSWHACADMRGATPGARNSISFQGSGFRAFLEANPNPFSPDGDGFEDCTVIRYTLPGNLCNIMLRIFDIRGRPVRMLIGGTDSGGEGTVIWDGKCDSGLHATTGMYILYLEGLHRARGWMFSEKLVLAVAGR